jgi:nitrous oxidase accessory protein NosD
MLDDVGAGLVHGQFHVVDGTTVQAKIATRLGYKVAHDGESIAIDKEIHLCHSMFPAFKSLVTGSWRLWDKSGR